MWWYDGGELPPAELRTLVGTAMPDQGSLIVGTDGLIVFPHGSTEAFVLPREKQASVTRPSFPPRDHYGEFLDAVLAGGTTPCSASFDYAGPLTESVLIGNVAARFPGETLNFDGKALAFPDKPGATQYLPRAFRHGWEPHGIKI
jgi:hypothetical protein